MDDETHFDRFWQASGLDIYNQADFARRLSSYDSDNKELSLALPQAATPLPKVKTGLDKAAQNRRSERTYSSKQLSLKDLSRILSSFRAWNGLEHRAYPSAGATYTTEIFCVCFNVEKYAGQILYYDAGKHGVVPVSTPAPSWEDAEKTLNMEITGEPNVLIIFTGFHGRATAKYGERGGRFALIEAGAAMQQLSLTIAGTRHLKGVAVGGMLDDVWLSQLGLAQTDAKAVLGYLVGQ